MSERLVRDPHVWDLHIHTPLGTPTKKNYDNCSAIEFVDQLIEIYSSFAEQGKPMHMISFTDHNQINVAAYKEFRRKSNIAIIPGIEMDIYLKSEDKNSKHVIFYFPETELDYLDELNSLIQDYRSSNSKIVFESFVMELVQKGKQFAVSPHAFKQDKRGIEYEWIDPDTAQKGLAKFSGLFFPFWEAAGTSDIVKAIEFLSEQSADDVDEHSIIAFSDSADWEKIKKYVAAPHQYFLCLNSFKGLLLAGSDKSRIIDKKETRPTSNPSEKIKSITLLTNIADPKSERKTIELSDRLTAIIGGRGKGKSALLDAMVYSINQAKIEENSRAKFVKKFNVQLENFVGSGLVSDLNIQYFSQSYINKLFSGNSSQNLYEYFQSYFDQLPLLSSSIADVEGYLADLKASEERVIDEENVADSFKQLQVLQSKKEYPLVKRRNIKDISLFYKQGNTGKSYVEAIMDILPRDSELWKNESLQKSFMDFTVEFVWAIVQRNYEDRLSKSYAKIMKKHIDTVKNAQSKQATEKSKSRESIESKLRSIYSREMVRVRQINNLYAVPQTMTEFRMESLAQPGEAGNKFFFVTYANKEHPVEFGRRFICESVDKRVWKNPQNYSNHDIFTKYAFDIDYSTALTAQQNINDIQQRIDLLDSIKHVVEHKIIYASSESIIDLHETSPGTQTNAIMELMLHTESSAPMFLDQPEDNIDNEARYEKLTKWIKQQKYNRQIILVTHDANVVINGDAECVIIADHDEQQFKYSYGALEYDNILDRASIILDGGKNAIRKRIEKYGE